MAPSLPFQIVQEITDMDDLLEDFLSQTERSLQAFKLYFMRHTPSDPLLSALKKFYRAILDFGVFLGNICFNSIGSKVKRHIMGLSLTKQSFPCALPRAMSNNNFRV